MTKHQLKPVTAGDGQTIRVWCQSATRALGGVGGSP